MRSLVEVDGGEVGSALGTELEVVLVAVHNSYRSALASLRIQVAADGIVRFQVQQAALNALRAPSRVGYSG